MQRGWELVVVGARGADFTPLNCQAEDKLSSTTTQLPSLLSTVSYLASYAYRPCRTISVRGSSDSDALTLGH